MMAAAAVGLISVPLFGYLSDRIGRRLMYGIGIVCVGLFAFPYYALLNTKIDGLVLLMPDRVSVERRLATAAGVHG
jgi:MFS family permease